MKTKILKGIVMMSAVVLGACTTTKYAAQEKDHNDDVYFSKAKAGDQVEYTNNNRYNGNNDYYDNYAGRINRFNSYSPFDYDSYLYSPYSYYGAAGLGLGLGYGLGSFYSPYSLYSPYSIYSPYSLYGTGLYGYGGYGGLYSAYGNGTTSYGARPSRGVGNPGVTYRGMSSSNAAGISRSSYSGRTFNGNTINGGYSQRPAATQAAPQVQRSYPTYNSPSSMGGGFSGGGGRGISSGRPGRG